MNSIFATLEPSNLPAKLDFDYIATRLSKQEQDGSTGSSRRYIRVNPRQEYDPEIFRLRIREKRTVYDSISATSTEVDTDCEDDMRACGMIWSGCYLFDLTNPPNDPLLGWVAGAGDPNKEVELLLGLNDRHNDVRGRHITFNFHQGETGFLSIVSRASGTGRYQVTVSGKDVARGRTHCLNQNPMTIRLGTLEYVFRYTEFGNSETFKQQRKRYLNNVLRISGPVFDLAPTPTGQARTFGAWTISAPLGSGTFGKVHSATDDKGRVAAIKVVDRTKSRSEVQNEIQVLQELTTLAETKNDQGRLLRLIEVIYPSSYESGTDAPFEEVALVLEPCVQGTFEQLTIARSGSQRSFMNTIDMYLFIDALRGVSFLHSQNWLHGDLKPKNIGWRDSRAIILDMGGAMKLRPHECIWSEPGTKGTIAYLAPEREMGLYDLRSDTWSMGVILFELIYGHHPCKFFQNPWRPGHEDLQSSFHYEYNKSIEKIQNGADPKIMQVSNLLLKMLRYEWAQKNKGERIYISEAVEHSCWPDQSDEASPKRPRREI